MKKAKKTASLFLAMVMILSIIVIAPTTVSAQTGGHTQADAVAWAQAQVGKSLDYDGAYGAQCVDLIAFYYQYLGNTTPGGNARDYCSNALPAGWQRITNYSGFVPQAGDICVWGANAGGNGSYGHVAIFINGNSSRINTIDQNYLGNMKTDYHSWATSQVTCFIRPDFVSADTQPPVISNVIVSEKSKNGYRITCTVTDNVGVTSVKFPTWMPNNSDPIWHEGTINGTTATIYISVAEHGNKLGYYSNHIYAYDAAGNSTGWSGVYITLEDKGPEITSATISKVSKKGFQLNVKVNDPSGIKAVKAPTWPTADGQPIWHELTITGDTASTYIKASEHNNAEHMEMHIYAYDELGNESAIRSSATLTDSPVEVAMTEYSGNIYKVYNYDFTWTEAKEWCEKQGGHLATISDENEWKAVKGALEKFNGVPCWLGAESTSGTWKWVTGEKFSYTNWSSGQPDCGSNVEFYLGTFDDTKKWLDCYSWNDYSSDGSSRIGGFVCEFEKKETPTQPTTKPTETTTTEPSEAPSQPTEDIFHVVAGSPELCNGAEWDPASTLNRMTLGDDGVYRITYSNVPAGTYFFKVTTNGAWDNGEFNLVGNAMYGGPNAEITVTEDNSTVLISFKESDMHANAYINGVLVDVGATEPTDPTTVNPTEPTEPTTIKPTEPTACDHGMVWTTTTHSTYFTKGKRVTKCAYCGEVIRKTTLPKEVLQTPSFTVKPKKGAVTIKYKKVKNAKGFVLDCKIGKRKFTKTYKTTKSKAVRFTGLKKGTRVTVWIKAYTTSGSKKAYSYWSPNKTVWVK